MASFSVIGFVECVKVLPDSCILFLSEYKQGAITLEEYKRMKEARGEKVSDALDSLFGNNS